MYLRLENNLPNCGGHSPSSNRILSQSSHVIIASCSSLSLMRHWTENGWTYIPSLPLVITAMGWSLQNFELIANALWCIWKDRNHFIFRKSPLNFQHTLFRAIGLQDSFATWSSNAKKQINGFDLQNKWQPPTPGALKINIDASFQPDIAQNENVDEHDFDCRWDHLNRDENRTQACPILAPQDSVLPPKKSSSVTADMSRTDLVLEVEQDVLNLPNSPVIRREQNRQKGKANPSISSDLIGAHRGGLDLNKDLMVRELQATFDSVVASPDPDTAINNKADHRAPPDLLSEEEEDRWTQQERPDLTSEEDRGLSVPIQRHPRPRVAAIRQRGSFPNQNQNIYRSDLLKSPVRRRSIDACDLQSASDDPSQIFRSPNSHIVGVDNRGKSTLLQSQAAGDQHQRATPDMHREEAVSSLSFE